MCTLGIAKHREIAKHRWASPHASTVICQRPGIWLSWFSVPALRIRDPGSATQSISTPTHLASVLTAQRPPAPATLASTCTTETRAAVHAPPGWWCKCLTARWLVLTRSELLCNRRLSFIVMLLLANRYRPATASVFESIATCPDELVRLCRSR
jgi:hypothetical protein